MLSRTPAPLPELFHVTMGKLEQMVRRYQQTGVYHSVSDYRDGWRTAHDPLLHPPAVRTFMRAVARSEKRPFIVALEVIYGLDHTVQLTVPRRDKLAPIVAPLLLVAVDQRNRYGHGVQLPSIGVRKNTPTIWQFFFNDEEGIKTFRYWLEQCCTNPTFKRVLKTLT